MGGQDDLSHSRSRLEQYFGMLLQTECLEAGLSVDASKMIFQAISRCARHFLCLRFTEFCMRTLSQNGRWTFLEWVAGFRLQRRREREALQDRD